MNTTTHRRTLLAVAAAMCLASLASPAVAAHYALLAGVDNYDPAYGASPLASCVNDVAGMRTALLGDSSRWSPVNITTLTDVAARKADVRTRLAQLAAQAVAGDVVLYFHSSHGGSHGGLNTYICTYNANYEDYELAADLNAFRSGVNVMIIVDACYSGGLFKDTGVAGTATGAWDFAGNVMRELQIVKGPSIKAVANIGWLTACNYDQYSWSGDPYSLFVGYVIMGFINGDANADSNVSYLELYNYAAPRATADNPDQTAQKLNDALLGATVAAAAPDQSDLDASLESLTLSWTTTGVKPWFGQLMFSHDGTDAAQSGDVDDNGASTLQTTVQGPGTLKFWWKVSSEANYDFLRVTVDGMNQGAISGDVDWQAQSLAIGAGSHVVRWTYTKDYLYSSGLDCGWVDQIAWEMGGRYVLPVSFPDRWVAVQVWDGTTGQYLVNENRYAPTQIDVAGIVPNHWYHIGLWDYSKSRWAFGEWLARIE